jgi:hypothetical protein
VARIDIAELARLDRTEMESRLLQCGREHDRLRSALQRLVDNVLDYEKVNNLSPNPGRKYCWDSVAHAVSVLEQTN